MANKAVLAHTDEVGNYLLYWRKQRRLSLERLSARLSTSGDQYVSPKTLNRWEKGETQLPQWATEALAKTLKIGPEELLYGPREADPALPLNVSAAYTGLNIEIAETVIKMGYTSWIASQPDDARKAVQGVMPWLEAAQRRAGRSAIAIQGQHLLARAHELLGALALDQLDNDAAISHFRHAVTLSEGLRDENLIVAHMTQLGDGYRRKGDKELALDIMGGALARAQHALPATRGYILQMIAYTAADAGDERAFDRYIGKALDLLGHSSEAEGVAQRDYIPFEVLEIYGKATRDFGRPVEALTYLRKAEDALIGRPNVPRWRAALTISQAQALCDAGELEEGVRLAIQGMTLAHSCQSPRQMNRVRKLMRKMEASEYAQAAALVSLRDVVYDIYTSGRKPLAWQPQHAIT